MKIAWGITGSGDKIKETFEMMSKLSKNNKKNYDVEIFVSKSGEQARAREINLYKIWTEKDANTPFSWTLTKWRI